MGMNKWSIDGQDGRTAIRGASFTVLRFMHLHSSRPSSPPVVRLTIQFGCLWTDFIYSVTDILPQMCVLCVTTNRFRCIVCCRCSSEPRLLCCLSRFHCSSSSISGLLHSIFIWWLLNINTIWKLPNICTHCGENIAVFSGAKTFSFFSYYIVCAIRISY